MAQINKYTNKAAYTADTDRLATKSAVSFIADDNLTVFDGVNIVVEKQSASEGDLVVFDKSESRVRFVKAKTLVRAQLPSQLYPFGVVVGWRNDKVHFVTLSGLANLKWAHAYEARLAGLNTASAGTLNIPLTAGSTTETLTVSWTSGATLASIATQIDAASAALTVVINQKWTASVDGSDIIISHNSYALSTVGSVTGSGGAANVVASVDTVDLQSSYAYLTGTEYINCFAGIHRNGWGCNYPKFYNYQSVSGSTPTSNVSVVSDTIVNEASFNDSDYCATLRGAYTTYEDYLRARMIQYPSAYGASLRDGKTTSAILYALKGTVVRGASEPRYPAVDAAVSYGISVDGFTTGFEAGSWWLPSVDEMSMMMRDRRLNSADTREDLVNDTLVKMSGTTMYGNNYVTWTCCEHNYNHAFSFTGGYGVVTYATKYDTNSVRPLSAF